MKLLTSLLYIAGFIAPVAMAESKQNNYISLGIEAPQYTLALDSKPDDGGSNNTYTYSPNLPAAFAVEVSVKGLTAGYSFDIPGTNSDSADSTKNVDSKYQDLSVSYFFDRIGFDLAKGSLKGANATSASNISSDTLSANTNAHRSDIDLQTIDGNIWLAPLCFNLSLDDFFDPASHSHGSGLAIIAVGSYDEMSLKANSAFIPSEYQADYGSDASINEARFKTITGQTGIAATLDLWGVYASGLFTYGTGNQKGTTKSQTTATNSNRMSQKFDAYIAIGYKGQNYFSSFDFLVDNPVYSTESMNINTSRSKGSFSIGRRF